MLLQGDDGVEEDDWLGTVDDESNKRGVTIPVDVGRAMEGTNNGEGVLTTPIPDKRGD